MLRSRNPNNLGVSWHVPGRKRPVEYSTKADSDLLALLCSQGLTWNEAYDTVLYSIEAKNVCLAYIERGYGDVLMSDFGVQ